MSSYLNDRLAIDRLKKEYNEHNKLIIGFDFDNTVYDYHDEGLDLEPIINILRKCSDLGFFMCLITIPDRIIFKTRYVRNELNIRVDGVNESPVMKNKEKPYVNILLDDRAGLSASYNILKTTLKELKL